MIKIAFFELRANRPTDFRVWGRSLIGGTQWCCFLWDGPIPWDRTQDRRCRQTPLNNFEGRTLCAELNSLSTFSDDMSFRCWLVEALFTDIALCGENRYPFRRIASSRGPHLTTGLGRGKRCGSAVLRSGGLSLHRSPSIEGGSANHASLGRVKVS